MPYEWTRRPAAMYSFRSEWPTINRFTHREEMAEELQGHCRGGGLPALGRALQFADLVEAGGGRLLQPASYVSNINGFNEIFERTMRTHGESPTFFFLL